MDLHIDQNLHYMYTPAKEFQMFINQRKHAIELQIISQRMKLV